MAVICKRRAFYQIKILICYKFIDINSFAAKGSGCWSHVVIFNEFHLINKLNFGALVKQTEMEQFGVAI